MPRQAEMLPDSDFIDAADLARLLGCSVRGLYNAHRDKSGPFAPILTKLGKRVGAWRADYEEWREAQRKFKPPINSASAAT
jgi:predicted DNA-binding transcriptional regulator AlpA